MPEQGQTPGSGTLMMELDASGKAQFRQYDHGAAAYSAASLAVATATAATDVWCIRGGVGKIIRLQGIRISGTASANVIVPISLIKRAMSTGGTSTAVPAVPHDSLDPASVASILAYTANPTGIGTPVGLLRGEDIIFAGSSAPNLAISSVLYQFSVYDGKLPTLRGVDECICVNLNGATVSSGAITVDAQWTEKDQ